MIFDKIFKIVLVFAVYIVYNYKRRRFFYPRRLIVTQEVIILAADMHCHTNRSDGSDSPEYVIRLARQLGLSALAITDHDTYAADCDAEGLGKKLGIRVINGVECSTFDHVRGHKVHILCYNIKHRDAVDELLATITRNRTEATLRMLEKVSRLYPITEEMVMENVSDSGFIGKQHISLALMKAGYSSEMYGDLNAENKAYPYLLGELLFDHLQKDIDEPLLLSSFIKTYPELFTEAQAQMPEGLAEYLDNKYIMINH